VVLPNAFRKVAVVDLLLDEPVFFQAVIASFCQNGQA